MRRRPLRYETLEARQLLAGDLATNLAEPMDTNGDLAVDSLDLVRVFSALILSTEGQDVGGMVDVDNDGVLTPADLLPPLRHLMNDQVSPEVQGQYIPAMPIEIASMAGVPQGNATLAGRIYDASGVAEAQLEVNGVPYQEVELVDGGAFIVEAPANTDPNSLRLVVTDLRGNTTTMTAAELTLPEPLAAEAPATTIEDAEAEHGIIVSATTTAAIDPVAVNELVTLDVELAGGDGGPYEVGIDFGDTSGGGFLSVSAGSLQTVHSYASPGHYEMSVTARDASQNETTTTADAFVSGVSLDNGVLQLIGTKWSDYGSVWELNGQLWVYGSFLDSFQAYPGGPRVQLPGFRSYDVQDVQDIRFYGLNGNDAFLANTSVPTHQFGGNGNDYLVGGHAADVIFGGLGDDFILGRGGNDNINAGKGFDVAFGGRGNDMVGSDSDNSFNLLFGDQGDDNLRGRGATNYYVDRDGTNLFDGSFQGVDFAFGNLLSTYIDIDFIYVN